MKKCSIMMIDDDETDRYLLSRMLKKLDVATELFEAQNGREALDFLTDYEAKSKEHPEDFPPVLIFLDINMPIMGGFEFLDEFAKLKQLDEKYTSSIFAMLSSSEKEEDRERAAAYDFVKGFITKGSLTPEHLQELIIECLS